MTDTRLKNANWSISANDNGKHDLSAAQLAVLMDIRDELQRLNSLLHCENFTDIPNLLRMIRGNTAKPRGRKKERTP